MKFDHYSNQFPYLYDYIMIVNFILFVKIMIVKIGIRRDIDRNYSINWELIEMINILNGKNGYIFIKFNNGVNQMFFRNNRKFSKKIHNFENNQNLTADQICPK